MKEHTDDVLLSVKESTATVDSTLSDEIVTRRQKIEGIFGGRDDGDDVMVDVVSGDASVDDHGDSGIDLGSERETVTRDRVIKDVAVVKEVSDDLVESRVVSLEKVEVVKEVIQENVVTTVGSGSDCDDQKSGKVSVVGDFKMASEPSKPSSKEPETGGGEIEVSESVQVVDDGDHGEIVVGETTQKETEVLTSSKIPEPIEGCVVAVELGLVSKDKAEDGENNQSSLAEVVEEGACEDIAHVSPKNIKSQDAVDQTNNESIQSTIEATTDDAHKSRVGDSNMIVESMKAEPQISMKVGFVINEKTVKDEVLDSTKIPESPTIVDEVVDHKNAENLDTKAKVDGDQMSKEESAQSTIEVRTDNASKSEDSKMDDEPQIIKGEIAVKDENEDPEKTVKDDVLTKETVEQPAGSVQEVTGEDNVMDEKTVKDDVLTKETVDQPAGSVQEVTGEDNVMDEKTVKDDALNSSKTLESLTMASLGLEDVDVVVVDESLEGKNEAQDGVSVDPTLFFADNKSLSTDVVNAGTFEVDQKSEVDPKTEVDSKTEVDQKVEVDSTSKNEKSSETTPTDEVAGCTKVDIVTMAHEEPNSHVQALTDGAILVENQSINDNDVTDSSKHDVVAYKDSESSSDKMTPGIANKVVETDIGVQTTKVEPTTIGGDSSNFQEDQGLIANASNEGEPQTNGAHGVLPANSEFLYEEAHMDRGEDAGMDIDEVLGWKDETHSEDGSKKRKALDSVSDGLEKRPTLHTETVEAKPSFKVGAVIQKVASQPTGPPLKGEPADHVAGNSASIQSPGPTQMGNQVDKLSQLHLAAQDPMKGYSFVNTIIPFFKSHRAAVLSKSKLNLSGEARKRKTSNENESDEFEFDDVNDSYWTDRIIQNHPEEQVLQENLTGGGEHQVVAYEQEKPPVKPARRSNKKRFFSSNHEIEANEQSELIARRQQNLATEVLMKFAGGIYFPSEIHLNKMFRRFGPLMESETEVDRHSGRARVVFKKCSDAEVAHSSAGKFNIFGSVSVNYELNYAPLISYKPLPLPLTQDPAC